MSKGTPGKSKSRKSVARRWIVGLAIMGLIALVGFYILARLSLQLWMYTRVPPDAPRIAFSLDDTWLAKLGVTDATYQQAMTRVGARLVTLRPGAAGSDAIDRQAAERLLERNAIDGVLLTGGGDVDPALYGGILDKTMLVHRQRDDFEIALIQAARARSLPILGICRGCQILNVACGGTLRNLREDDKLKSAHFAFAGHPVELAPDSRLARILGVTRIDDAYSFHGQAADQPGADVTVVARGPGGTVEAIEVDAGRQDAWIVAVQWHPEMAVTDEIQNRLFHDFIEQARQARQRRLGNPK